MAASGQKVRELRQTIVKRIREFRQVAGLTQEQLAEKVDIAPETLSRYETGRLFPSLALVVSLADALNATVPALLSEPQDDTQAERVSRVAALFSALSEEDAAFLESELISWMSYIKRKGDVSAFQCRNALEETNPKAPNRNI